MHSPKLMNGAPLAALMITCLLSVSARLDGQTYIVDDSGGPGVHFTDLATAVQSVPDGSVLQVRAGYYQNFSITGKGLSIIGEDRNSVQVSLDGDAFFACTSAAQRILVSSLTFAASPSTPAGTRVLIQQTAGAVEFDDVDVRLACQISYGITEAQVLIDRCAAVHLHRCRITAGVEGPYRFRAGLAVRRSYLELAQSEVQVGTGAALTAAASGMEIDSSDVTLFSTSVEGGTGWDGYVVFGAPMSSGDGGHGISMTSGSALTVMNRSTEMIRGGKGGDWYSPGHPWFNYPGDGGDAIRQDGGSHVVLGTAALAAGAGGSGNPPGSSGSPCTSLGGSTLTNHLLQTPTIATLNGSPVPGSIVSFDLSAAPGSQAFLVFGVESRYLPFAPNAIGALLVDPALPLLLGPFTLTTASHSYPITIWPGWPTGIPLFMQYATLQPTTTVIFSNSAMLLVKP